ncbi:MAG TPA: hypothetical protein VHS09_12265 [Polyangiaceae bacterium]|jgi:hypothetical protein|nr:hypothetical protein [Polyangiaceae bacterium]
MTAAATIARHHKALLDLLEPARVARHDDRLLAVLDAAMAQLAVEGAALRALADHAEVDTREHFDAHGRARLALFRMATSPSDSVTVAHAFDELRAAFVHRTHSLAGTLVEHLDAQALARLGEEMDSLR